jgi:hypothetical protein
MAKASAAYFSFRHDFRSGVRFGVASNYGIAGTPAAGSPIDKVKATASTGRLLAIRVGNDMALSIDAIADFFMVVAGSGGEGKGR